MTHEIRLGKLAVLEVLRELESADTETLCKVFNIDKKNKSTVSWALLRYKRQGLVKRVPLSRRPQKYGRTPYLYHLTTKGVERINFLKTQLNSDNSSDSFTS